MNETTTPNPATEDQTRDIWQKVFDSVGAATQKRMLQHRENREKREKEWRKNRS